MVGAIPKRYLTFFTLFFFFFHASVLAAPASNMAFDIEAPVIKHNSTTQAVVVDQQVVISASVTDATGVENVQLHYRTSPVGDFKIVDLEAAGDDLYTVTLYDEWDVGTVEYYIKATDVHGNVVSWGSAYMPLTLEVTAVALGHEEPAQKANKKLWWAVGGAVLLGAAALALGGGGGGGSDEPTTGNVTFGGDTP